ncbi:MAG: ABC transporter substrate-binding protein [Aureispira sp.]|nr:ABC transporter substrate-binding protein [Aureispira sp.]
MNKTSLVFSLILIVVTLISCGPEKPATHEEPNTMVDSVENVILKHAQNFMIQKEGSYTIITIKSAWKNAQEQFKYVLYPKGEAEPTGYENATPVALPIERVICTSTTQIAMLDFLGLTNKIVGLANADYVYNSAIQERIKNGEIEKIGNDNTLDYERVLALKPDIVFTYSIGDSRSYQKFKELGVPAVMVSEFIEVSPLGRLEWVQFFAHFFGETKVAQEKLMEVWEDYEVHKKLVEAHVSQQTDQPKVFTGAAYEGTWHVAGGKSFVAQLIADAGGKYLWDDNTETGGVPLDVEAVFAKAKNADVWLNVLTASSQKQLGEKDEKYRSFKAFEDEQIYSYTKRVSPNEGYDFFESAIVHPERILKDLIKIFYPELLLNYDLYYYQKLEKG